MFTSFTSRGFASRIALVACAIGAVALSTIAARRPAQVAAPASQAQAVGGDNGNALAMADEASLFFAVLEGCYRDGIDDELVDVIVAEDPVTHRFANFVDACPLCMPVVRAFKSYRASPEFVGTKEPTKSFGSGIDAEIARKLRSKDVLERQGAMHSLVQGWIEQWISSHRLTDEERKHWQFAMSEGRKLGTKILESSRTPGSTYSLMKECPSCEACNGACRSQR